MIKALNNSFKNELDSGKESLKNLADEIMGKVNKVYSDIKNGIKKRHNSRIDKLERLLNYPDAVINEILSKILHKDVNLRFRIIETLRANSNLNIDLSKFKWEINDNEDGISPFFIISDDEKTDNPFEAVLKALVIAIPINEITISFEFEIKSLIPSFDFNKWFESLTDAAKNVIEDICIALTTMLNTAWSEGKEYVEEFFTLLSFDKIIEWLIDNKRFSFGLSGLISFTTAFDSRDNGKYTTGQAWFSTIYNLILSAISVFVDMGFGGKAGMQVLSFVFNLMLDGIFNFQNGHLWGYA